ncbi:MAG TPA: hypothetical protein VK249_21515 [Anaerolineales bacterium]|nr:hypothetical protein [Anaerolineales bacterium]
MNANYYEQFKKFILTTEQTAYCLYPSEYRVQAEALVEARRLVNGVLIEKI